MTHDDHSDDLHDRGLAFDLSTIMQRRHALALLGGGALIALVGCGENDKPKTASAATSGATRTAGTAAASTSSTAASASATAAVSPIPTSATPASACNDPLPEETAGPFPGDGSNGPNVLKQSGIVRSDIRSSIGTSSTAAGGIPPTIALTVVDTKKGCKPIAGAAVYLWHCDREGRYSLYSPGVTNENYLRGVQEADTNGNVTFKSIFPACYAGRWPHVHFEVYESLAKATSSANKLATSQLALPEAECEKVYATTGYQQSVRNLSQVSLKTDMVFSDGYDLQLAKMSGDVNGGYTATLVVGV